MGVKTHPRAMRFLSIWWNAADDRVEPLRWRRVRRGRASAIRPFPAKGRESGSRIGDRAGATDRGTEDDALIPDQAWQGFGTVSGGLGTHAGRESGLGGRNPHASGFWRGAAARCRRIEAHSI